MCDLHTGWAQNFISSRAGGEGKSTTKENVESVFENTVTAQVVGLFYKHVGVERKRERRKQGSGAAVQALAALLWAEIDHLQFLQVKG